MVRKKIEAVSQPDTKKMNMKHILLLISVSIFATACSSFNHPEELSVDERLQLFEGVNDSIMIVFDSIMEVNTELPQLIDSLMISSVCLEQFGALARETGGGVKIVANSMFVAKEISKIIENHAVDNTDIMIVIDKTNSMSDDLENIKIGLNQILSSLREKKNVRLSISTYGDKNIDGDLWYDFRNFESDFEDAKDFIETIQMTHGGDFPESVYDGIHEAFQEDFWISNSKRIVVLLGDAPSLDATLSTYTEKNIIELATQNNINMNFYPIVLSPYNGEYRRVKKMQNLAFIESAYPNPTNGPLSIRLNQFGSFTLEIFSQNAEILKSETINSDVYKTDLYGYPNGLYIVRISDENKNFDTRKIILNR